MGKSSRNQTVTQKTELPKWLDAAAQKNLTLADQIGSQPYVPYTGDRLAGFSLDQNNAYNMVRNNVGAGQQYLNPAFSAATDVTGFNAPQVNADQVNPAQIAGSDLSPYLNPFTQNVIDTTMGTLGRQNQQLQMQNASSAAKAGAFGGSRHGVVEGETNRGYLDTVSSTAAGLNLANFNNALNMAGSDAAMRQQAAMGNQAANLTASGQNANNALASGGLRLQGVNSLAGLASQLQTMKGQDAAALEAAGLADQQQRQQAMDLAYQQFLEQQNYPTQQLNLRLAAVGATPYGQTSTTTQPITSNSLAGIIGGGLGAAKLFGLFSDRTMKTDIQKLGKDPESGLPVYAYRYKGDPKNTPKIVGVMAQDVAKVAPHMVGKAGGKLYIKNPLRGAV